MPKVKQWKKGGEEDKFILKLIRQGKITAQTKPNALKAEYPNIFGGFSSNVMRNHLNILKFSNGLFCKKNIRITLPCSVFLYVIFFSV